MIIPCKKTRCLKYPSCISKEVIDCNILRAYYEYLHGQNEGLANRTSKIWGNIRLVLPNLLTIMGPISTKYGDAYSTSLKGPLWKIKQNMS